MSWTAAAATVDTTPVLPGEVTVAPRGTPARAIADPLEANLLYLHDGSRGLLLITVDALFVADLRERVVARLPGGLGPEQVFFAASHTHSAPPTDASAPSLGAVSQGYLETTANAIAAAANKLIEGPRRSVRLLYGAGTSQHGVYRRKRVLLRRGFEVAIYPNLSGPNDERVHVIALVDANGKRVAVLWSATCHPSCFPHNDRVSADFPGVVRSVLRTSLGPGVPVLFLQGFTGNIRPRCMGQPTSLRERIKMAINGPAFIAPTESWWRAWSAELAARVTAAASSSTREVIGPLRWSRREIPLAHFVEGAVEGKHSSLHRICFGDSLEIAGASFEPSVEHVALFERASRCATVIPVGYIDRVWGYLPTDAMLAEGGYEVEALTRTFGVRGKYREGPDHRLATALVQLDDDAPVTPPG